MNLSDSERSQIEQVTDMIKAQHKAHYNLTEKYLSDKIKTKKHHEKMLQRQKSKYWMWSTLKYQALKLVNVRSLQKDVWAHMRFVHLKIQLQ